MFKWFRKWLNGNDPTVFYFHDGERKRSVDPIEVERAFIASLGEDWRKELQSLSKPILNEIVGEEAAKIRDEREKLRSKVLYAIDTAFDVKPYKDGEGMTEVRRFELLTGYNIYCRDLIERARPFVKRQSRVSHSPESLPTENGSDSISPDTK